jgi:hypothetical protein
VGQQLTASTFSATGRFPLLLAHFASLVPDLTSRQQILVETILQGFTAFRSLAEAEDELR